MSWRSCPAWILMMAMVPAHAGIVSSSLEQFNHQIGDDTLEVDTYDGFEEFEGVADLAGFAQYDFRVDDGPWETIGYDTFYDAYKRAHRYPSLADMLAERPTDGDYQHRITFSDTTSATVSINGVRPAYADAIPVSPMFAVQGVAGGSWSRSGGNENFGVFSFDPGQFGLGDSFSVVLNAYEGDRSGAGQASAVFVTDVRVTFDPVDEVSRLHVPQWGLTDDLTQALTLTFTKGPGPADAGDDDPLTYRFDDGSRFEFEGEHVNLYSLADASPELGLAALSVEKAFVYQNVTSFILDATAPPVPEPGRLALTAVGGAVLALRWRRRRTRPSD